MKLKVERIECYYAKSSGKKRDYRFYVDLSRKASKEEEAARKEFIRRIKGQFGTEGRGYNWRVSVYVLRKVIDLLPDPLVVKAEMERFDREGVIPPEEPYRVVHLSVFDTDLPAVITLRFDHEGPVPEKFRRACQQWRVTHQVKRDEHLEIQLFKGREMTIVVDMLVAFESWLVFEKPWQELYEEAFALRQKFEEEVRANNYASDARFRAKYPDWDEWTHRAQEKERERVWHEEYEKRKQNTHSGGYSSYIFTGKYYSPEELTRAFTFLGLPLTASLQDVKKAYRFLSLQHHPDMPTGNEEMFKKLNNANELVVGYLKQLAQRGA